MIGTKIGSGGSSGAKYLTKTLEKHSIFDEYVNLSTYLIPKSNLPKLPDILKNKLHCLIVKPMSTKLSDAKKLYNIAEGVSRPFLPKLEAAVWVALLATLSHGRRPP